MLASKCCFRTRYIYGRGGGGGGGSTRPSVSARLPSIIHPREGGVVLQTNWDFVKFIVYIPVTFVFITSSQDGEPVAPKQGSNGNILPALPVVG